MVARHFAHVKIGFGEINAKFSNRHFVESALGRSAAALVIYLRRTYVAVAQEVLNFPDIDAGVEKERSGRCSKPNAECRRSAWR